MIKLVNRRLSKKAQGLSTTTLVLLILAGIVLVVVVLGFTKGWGYVFDKIGLLPGDLEAAAQSCGVSASSSLKTSYCNEFKEVIIAGKKQYVNCQYLEGLATFEKLPANTCKKITEEGVVRNLAIQLCGNKNLKKDDLVNNQRCDALSPDLYT